MFNHKNHSVVLCILVSLLVVNISVPVYADWFLSPQSSFAHEEVSCKLRVRVRGGSQVRRVIASSLPIRFGEDEAVSADIFNLNDPDAVISNDQIAFLNSALKLLKKRAKGKKFREYFNLEKHRGRLGSLFAVRYLLQEVRIVDWKYLADVLPLKRPRPQTMMLNIVLFSGLVRSPETLLYAFRHEMDHANPLTERQVRDRDLLYFLSLPRKSQEGIIADLERIEEAEALHPQRGLAASYRRRTGQEPVRNILRYCELLRMVREEGGITELVKDAAREIDHMKRDAVLSADGTRISYAVGGNQRSEKTFLFIHGWVSQSKDWRRQLYDFERDFRTVTVNTRGFEYSGQADYSSSHPPKIQDWVEDVKAVILKEDLRNVVILGHSMGGMIGYHLCADPEIKQRIIGFIPKATTLISPGDSFVNPLVSKLVRQLKPAFPKMLDILNNVIADRAVTFAQRRILRNFTLLERLFRVIVAEQIGLFINGQPPEDFHHLWTNATGATKLRDALVGLWAMMEHDAYSTLPDIEVPILAFIGSKDGVVRADVQLEQIRLIKEAAQGPVSKIVVDGAGHYLHWDEFELVNGFIRQYVARWPVRAVLAESPSDEISSISTSC